MRPADGTPLTNESDARESVVRSSELDAERRSTNGQSPPDGPTELTVDEVIALHRDEWILMKVTGFDEDGWPKKGFVLAHSPRRDDISKALAEEPPRAEPRPGTPHEPYYVFNAFPRGR